jgi:hypothetical protein
MRQSDDTQSPWLLLEEWPAVSYRTACALLDIHARQLRNLIRQGKLERVGEGHQRKVTSISVRRYGGFVAVSDRERQNSGNLRRQTAMSGSNRQSAI